MADWKKIKTEYITTNTSYRKLAEKHGVNYRTICVRSKQEGWIEQRERHINKTTTDILDAVSKKQVDRAANLISVSDILLDVVKNLLESNAEVLKDTQSMKHISGVLKDIKEIQMIRSDADMREQEARIANLRKQAEKDEVKDQGYHGVVLLPVVADMPAPPEGDNDG
jgi:predicted xylose isomerase-like sugar epimerase